MANTTWNPSDKTASVTLSGGNLIATATASATGVRAIDRQVTGKFYWENTVTVWAGANTDVGFGLVSVVLGSSGTPVGAATVIKSGAISVNNVGTGSSLGALANGSIIGIAVDFTAQLAWFRLCPAGNWNGSGTANPATGTGGVSISSISGGFPLYPLAAFGAASDSVTANFGDTAFSGAVPAGFTSGFTAGAVIPTSELVTQVALEEWLIGSPSDTQLTQISIEEWATVQTVVTQLTLTQIAIEEWASVVPPIPPFTARQYAVTVVS